MSDFEKELVQSFKDAVKESLEDSTVDLISDMVRDNPDWWASEAHQAVKTALTEAAKCKELIQEIVKEYLTEMDIGAILREQIQNRLESMITPELILKAAKDAMKGE